MAKYKVYIFFSLVICLSFSSVAAQVAGEKPGCASSNCHANLMGQEFLHDAFEDGCENCHETNDGQHPQAAGSEFSLTEDVPDLCYGCHDELNELTVIHSPVEEGECLACHSPHGSSQPYFLLSEENENICESCHEDVQEQVKTKSSIHKPLAGEVKCLECHSPHASQHSGLLRAEQPQVCFDCHNKIASPERARLEAIQSTISSKKFVHSPVADGECTACHNSHAADNYPLLSLAFPSGVYAAGKPESFALCFDCHESDLLEIATMNTVTNFRHGDKNLHYLHISKKDKGRSCKTCHNVHGSDNPHLIAETVDFGEWKMPINFRGNEKGGTCLPGCHEEKTYVR